VTRNQLGQGDDRDERIVDLMSDAAGERAQGVQPLRVIQLALKRGARGLRVLQGGDVRPNPDPALSRQPAIRYLHPAAIAHMVAVLRLRLVAGEQRLDVELGGVGAARIEAVADLPFRDEAEGDAGVDTGAGLRRQMQVDEG
jgi:hypothetical protein